ncbi:MAG: OmpA family protein [Acidocella sp.]|nr:OmpA family protein [Acidocella sp.]
MRKFLTFSALLGGSVFSLAGCASLPFFGHPAATAPATPVFFQPASAALDGPALAAVKSAATAAMGKPDAEVIVVGAADSVGNTAANKLLAASRADAVAAALSADGVAKSRIYAESAGVAASPTPTGIPAQFARRAMIRIQ